jgi:hypothetical protein
MAVFMLELAISRENGPECRHLSLKTRKLFRFSMKREIAAEIESPLRRPHNLL